MVSAEATLGPNPENTSHKASLPGSTCQQPCHSPYLSFSLEGYQGCFGPDFWAVRGFGNRELRRRSGQNVRNAVPSHKLHGEVRRTCQASGIVLAHWACCCRSSPESPRCKGRPTCWIRVYTKHYNVGPALISSPGDSLSYPPTLERSRLQASSIPSSRESLCLPENRRTEPGPRETCIIAGPQTKVLKCVRRPP